MESLLARASTYAGNIDFVIALVAIIVFTWLFLAEAILLYFCLRFKKKEGVEAQYITGEKHHEMKWIHWPHHLVLVCDVFIIIFAVQVWYEVKQELPPAEDTIGVVAQQWAWTFRHSGQDRILGTADDIEIVNELHVELGKTYHFKLESLDVMHDFSVPVFRLKQDSVPGRVITGWFKPNRIGEYDVQCAEMCGIGHGVMGARIHVDTPEDYQDFLDQHSNKTTISQRL